MSSLIKLGQGLKIPMYKAISISVFFISKMKMDPGVYVETVRKRLKVVPDGLGL